MAHDYGRPSIMTSVNDQRMMSCPKWSRCFAPVCPLDENMAECKQLKGETRCRLGREERAELGADLPWGGLWPKEIAAKKRWEESEGIA